MSIKIEHDGQQIEVLTPEEALALNNQLAEATTKLNEATETIKKKDQVINEKNTNFKKYKDMSEEEKSKYSAGELEAKRIAEEATERASALEKKINEDNEKRFNDSKEKAIRDLVGNDKELYDKVSKNWDLVNLTGTDDAVISQRAGLAFTIATGGKAPNPLNREMNGDISGYQRRTSSSDFSETDKGKQGMDMIGDVEAGLGIPKETK